MELDELGQYLLLLNNPQTSQADKARWRKEVEAALLTTGLVLEEDYRSNQQPPEEWIIRSDPENV